ncbi:hypothetical protein EOK75_10870 [Pseudorhodobacter turbinis]|uniref:Uncharacterized protein n=1 Tax=Pseudorhodobacter turbinis TaxID=2500533 RepID=A0A4V1E0X8_9RHOB|nr:hypothetical protein [Pseudorhodobacter turbinis]QCO56184.1 hypothetical protein EOK75_10870 [Pseudorhodobacter turbinis]
MTDAEKAYAAAERMIEEAKRSGEFDLDFDTDETRALEELPPSIAELSGVGQLDFRNTRLTDASLAQISNLSDLRTLGLAGTPVTDAGIAHIRNHHKLEALVLSNTKITEAALPHINALGTLVALLLDGTQISDIRLLRDYATKMATSGPFLLTFRHCTAAKADERVATISEIEDSQERAQALLDLIDAGWVPPGEVVADAPLAPGYVLPPDGPMRSQDSAPIGGDEDQEGLREDLVDKAATLIEAIGASNEWAALRRSAERYRTQIAKPLAEIRLKRLYSAGNTLRVAYEADAKAEKHGRFNDVIPPLIAAPLQDVVETHGLFFMGFLNGADIHAQMLAGLTGQRRPDEVAAAEPLVTSLEDKPLALDVEDQAAMADDLAAAKGEGPSAEIGEKMLRGRVWNMLGAAGRAVYAAGKGGTTVILSHDFLQWLLGNETLIKGWLQIVQGSASGWFTNMMQVLRELIG